MNIAEVLKQLDSLDYKDFEGFLLEKMKEALEEGDNNSRITLLNEMIGFCRDSCQFNKTKIYSNELLTLLEDEGLVGTQAYATSLLNIANADRASGDLDQSLEFYKKAYDIYDELLDPKDFLFASINNNMALLYQEMKDFESACKCLKKSLKIIDCYDDKIIEKAITYTNLAQSQLRLNDIKSAKESIDTAMSIFDDGRQNDYHYSGALAVYAELLFKNKEYAKSADYYEKAMNALEKQIGKNGNYDILKANRDEAVKMAEENGQAREKHIRGLDICRMYYEQVGAPMIHEKFPKYESRISVGLVGEGSDCFGYDDELSRDHDWGPGFCMWLDDVTYDAIGKELQAAYEELPSEFMGYRRMTTREAQGRLGVLRVKDFYSELLHMRNGIPRNEGEWLTVAEEDLAAATNGAIFRDDDGVFFSMRNDLLAYYPERVYRRKLAYELVRMSQTGQYNFSRCLKRGDKVTAQMYLAEFMEHTLHVLFLLNKKYAPYKKWLMKAASTRLTILPEVTDILIAISDMDLNDDNICSSIEIIAQLVLNELKNQGHVIAFNRRDPYFLEPYGQEIATSINYLPDETNVKADSMKNRHADLVDQIVVAEWEAFDKVINEGGRADCQDNWDTFSKMRKSQYLTWSIEMLESFLADMKQAGENGWNLITEKYARMEESTAYDHYVQIADKLPKKDDKTKAIVEEIVKIQVGFMEDFAEDYPKVAGTARKIHTYEDTPYDTSYETYLRGELLTYSPKTLELYGRYVVDHVNKENNIAKEIMTNTALLYGYKSLEDLESKLD